MAARRATPRGPVDWTAIRQRVEAAGRAVAGETTASPEQVRLLLEERARALARPAVQLSPGEMLELITFALADEVYAIESRYVHAVFLLADLSPLPGAEPPVLGVTTWRGGLLTILDLRRVLGLSVATLNALSRVIVVGQHRPAFGILADAAQDLVTLQASEVQALHDAVAARRQYLRGVTADAVLLLDAEQLLCIHV